MKKTNANTQKTKIKLTHNNRRVISQVKKTNGESTAMLMMTLSLMRLGLEEAQVIFDELLKGLGDRVETLKVILPFIASSQQARLVIDMNLKDKDPWVHGSKATVLDGVRNRRAMIVCCEADDHNLVNVVYDDGSKDVKQRSEITLAASAIITAESEKRRLQNLMGNAWFPIMGLSTRHYKLDLSKDIDRVCLRTLGAHNNTETSNRRRQRLGDTSQCGNWMNFRNEVFRGNRDFRVTTQFLDPIKTHGMLEFDYVSTVRPGDDCKCLSDQRFVAVLMQLFQLEPEQKVKEELAYEDMRRKMRLDFEHGLWSDSLDRDNSKFGTRLAELYGEIRSRKKEGDEDGEDGENDEEESDHDDPFGSSRPNSRAKSRGGTRTRTNTEGDSDGDEPHLNKSNTVGLAQRQAMEAISGTVINAALSDRDMAKELPKLIPGNKFSEKLMGKNLKTASSSFRMMKRMSGMVKIAARIQTRARKKFNAVRLLSTIEDVISTKWISSVQGRVILDKFIAVLGISSEDKKVSERSERALSKTERRVIRLHPLLN